MCRGGFLVIWIFHLLNNFCTDNSAGRFFFFTKKKIISFFFFLYMHFPFILNSLSIWIHPLYLSLIVGGESKRESDRFSFHYIDFLISGIYLIFNYCKIYKIFDNDFLFNFRIMFDSKRLDIRSIVRKV